MKKLSKLLVLVLALVLMLALVACDKTEGGNETSGNSDETNGQTNVPSESGNDTDGESVTKEPEGTSEPSDGTGTGDTVKPDEPVEPEDPNKTVKIVDSVNQVVEALSNAGGQVGSTLPTVSLDSLVELFQKLDFQVTGLPDFEGALIVKDGMVSYSEYDRNIIVFPGEEPEVSLSKYIYKLYSSGLLMVETDEDGVVVSSGFSSFEDSGIELPNISIDLNPLLDALRLTKDDIKADVEKQTYTFSEEYLTRVSNAIYNLFEEIGGQISVLGVNENNIISSLVLDFGKFETEGKVTATAKVGKTGKEIAVDITVGDTSFGMSVECKELFTFDMKLAGTQDAVTSFELNAEVPTSNIKLAVKINFAQTTSFEATLFDLNSGISVTGTCKTETNGKTTVDADISVYIKKGETSDGISSESTEKIDIKFICTVVPDANGALEKINVQFSAKLDGAEVLSGELNADLSAITAPSKECASLKLLIQGSVKFDVSVKTVEYSEKGFEYQINVDYSDGTGSSEKLQISVKAPSTLEIELTDIEKAYIANADKIAADYQKIQDKIDELDALANAYVGSSSYNPENGDPDAFFTVDKETGLVYVTHIWSNWSKDDFSDISYEAYTYVELGGVDEFKDDMAENLGDFKNYKEPFATAARKEIESVLAKEFEALGDDYEYSKDDYYVCCKDSDTNTYYVFDCYMSYTFGWVTFDHEPTADEIGSTSFHWYTLGTGKIHDFVTSSTGHTCSGCGVELPLYNSDYPFDM